MPATDRFGISPSTADASMVRSEISNLIIAFPHLMLGFLFLAFLVRLVLLR